MDEIDGLDEGIREAVMLLRKHGIETFASCEGGAGHAYLEATIRFEGDRGEGFRALAIAMQHYLPVEQLNRVWWMIDGEPSGPFWELTFHQRPAINAPEKAEPKKGAFPYPRCAGRPKDG